MFCIWFYRVKHFFGFSLLEYLQIIHSPHQNIFTCQYVFLWFAQNFGSTLFQCKMWIFCLFFSLFDANVMVQHNHCNHWYLSATSPSTVQEVECILFILHDTDDTTTLKCTRIGFCFLFLFFSFYVVQFRYVVLFSSKASHSIPLSSTQFVLRLFPLPHSGHHSQRVNQKWL